MTTETDVSMISHRQSCVVLMLLAIIAGLSMQMGLAIGPDDCDNDNFFETIGTIALFISLFGAPINALILLSSFTDSEVSSSRIFMWSFAHIAVLFLTMFLFEEAVFQDMFCGSNGPHYDIGAGF